MQPIRRISFCTVSMNRVQHIRETLPINITNNLDYPNLEFVLLDYNSSDGLEEYIKANLSHYIESGKLIYFRTFKPKYFHRSHSRNLLFRIASGEIVCNLDADNFTSAGFATYINEQFNKDDNIFLTTLTRNGSPFPRDVLGRICVRRDNFYAIGGFDEKMESYGFEDYDLANRLEMTGLKRTLFNSIEYLKAVRHSQDDRLCNEYVSLNLHSILLRYISPSCTEFVILLKNGNFKRGIIVDNRFHTYEEQHSKIKTLEFELDQKFSLLGGQWTEGNWERMEFSFKLNAADNYTDELYYESDRDCFSNHLGNFYTLKEPGIVSKAIMLFSQLSNRTILTNNLISAHARVNREGFGSGTVFKNFNLNCPLIID